MSEQSSTTPGEGESVQDRELRETLGTALGTAQEHLQQNGGFLPFAVTLSDDGELRIVLVTPGEPDEDGDIDAGGMLADIHELLRQGRDDFKAVAVVSDVSLPDHGSDGIHGAAEHRDGEVRAAIIPYTPTVDGFAFSAMEPDTHEPSIWVD
ncbi:hypothetical protein CQ020_11705 [Arthrobacter sp. MYb23]|uniref:hypothetical protein n=1 Tax=unclassified Arthrobacter TaxID=235627 RepID=UPI000CFE0CB4|nr:MULTISPECIES: hypothetical protein [unclassified Arthrobacter]PRB41440.1 hypothetical protein CQ038_13515 [Arthrobacter sp. MYb51]PRB95724.1 hypothetical protein CQ020_11705 [Arthrobacter sp. MYb23]